MILFPKKKQCKIGLTTNKKKNLSDKMGLNTIYSSTIDTNGAWWSHVLVQELAKILENHEECSE